MKRFLLIVLVLSIFVSLFAKDAEKIIEKVYKNNANISTLDTLFDMSRKNHIKKDDKFIEKRTVKRILIKKPDKKKIINLNKNTLAPLSEAIPEKKAGKNLYPEVLFDMENFLKDYNIFLTKKDERIKRGREEIIAIKKGQKLRYPQIRIAVKNKRAEEIKFYSVLGKKYYHITVDKYIKIKNTYFPAKITEKLIAEKNEITNTINYTDVKLNKSIPDSEF